MSCSFLATRARQAALPEQPGRFRYFLEYLFFHYVIVTLLALTLPAPGIISAQTDYEKQTQSDAEALAEAARLNQEVYRLYKAKRS